MLRTSKRKWVVDPSSMVETSITLPHDVVQDLPSALVDFQRKGVAPMVQSIVSQKLPEMRQWLETPIRGAWPMFLECACGGVDPVIPVTIRFSSEEMVVLDQFAARYTGGNRSQLIRRILMDAIDRNTD